MSTTISSVNWDLTQPFEGFPPSAFGLFACPTLSVYFHPSTESSPNSSPSASATTGTKKGDSGPAGATTPTTVKKMDATTASGDSAKDTDVRPNNQQSTTDVSGSPAASATDNGKENQAVVIIFAAVLGGACIVTILAIACVCAIQKQRRASVAAGPRRQSSTEMPEATDTYSIGDVPNVDHDTYAGEFY